MGIKEKVKAFGKKFKLDSHHGIERFGVAAGVMAISGLLVFGSTGASAFTADKGTLNDTAVWTSSFTTSKTGLSGSVNGVYTNETGNKALVMMQFKDQAKISYSASNYEAFLLGSSTDMSTETLDTEGVTGSFYVFGSTGYVGVLLSADEPFDEQVLNLTVRANTELSYTAPDAGTTTTPAVTNDESFNMFDQWRVFVNPGANKTQKIDGLDSASFDPAEAFYEIVLEGEEETNRGILDQKLVEMRTNLAQIDSYSSDLVTTKVDGMFLKAPKVPASVAGDQITGETASESEDGVSSLALDTATVSPGGFDIDWRAGNVYDGYLKDLVPSGESYVQFLSEKSTAGLSSDSESTTTSGVNDMDWVLSDGTDLAQDYRAADTTMRPLTNVMNNLSQAYQDYYKNKVVYQSDLVLDLLELDVKLRDVQSNSSVNSDEDFLITHY